MARQRFNTTVFSLKQRMFRPQAYAWYRELLATERLSPEELQAESVRLQAE